MLSISRAFGLGRLGSATSSSSTSSSTLSHAKTSGKPRTTYKVSLQTHAEFRHTLHMTQFTNLRSRTLLARAVCRQYASLKKTSQRLPNIPRNSTISGVEKHRRASQYRDEDAIDDLEGENYPYLDATEDGSDIPSTLEEPMESIKLPTQRHTFNYKTYRYKDVQYDDDRVSASITVTASRGAQLRPGEQPGDVIVHTKENPGEDLSKDVHDVPVGLDALPVSYTRQMMKAIYDILKEEHGEDIVVIDISNKTNWVPTMMIVTATSARHCVALANRIAAELKRSKLHRAPKIERNVGDEWALVSAGVVVVEIMTLEQREYMDLERLWVLKKSSAETFEFDEEEERFMYDDEDGMWDDDDL